MKCYECASPERAGMVQSATAALEQTGVPIPRVRAVVGHVILADWVPGKPLTQDVRPTTFSELASYQARIHRANVSAMLPSVVPFFHLEWLIERVRTASRNYVAAKHIEELCQTIAGLTPKDLKPGIVQPDFIKSNIVRTPDGELVIVDNEFLGIGIGYEFDILNAARVIAGDDEPQCQQYIAAYTNTGDCGTLLRHERFWQICYLTKLVGKHYAQRNPETAQRCLSELESTTRQYMKDHHA
jgi:hypothetical protein